MKQIPLRVINEKIPAFEKPVRFDYAETMLGIVRDGGVQGLTIDDMSVRIPTLNKLKAVVEEGSDYLLLEEAEYRTLLSLVKAHRFRYVFLAAVQMRDELKNAATVEVDVKEE